jgi:predicted permease
MQPSPLGSVADILASIATCLVFVSNGARLFKVRIETIPTAVARNEARKLYATFQNNLAVAMIVVGVVTPLFVFTGGLVRNVPDPPLTLSDVSFAIMGFCLCVMVGTGLHMLARRALREYE